MRNTKKVYCEADNLPARFDGSAIAFSPNDKLILAGTALEGPRDPNPSKLVFMERHSLEPVKEIPVSFLITFPDNLSSVLMSIFFSVANFQSALFYGIIA